MSRRILAIGLFSTAVAVALVISYARPMSTSQFSENVTEPVETGSEGRVEAELLVLRSAGFQPREIKRRPGPFVLAVQNHSSQQEISLTLKQEAGPSIRQIRFAQRQSKFRDFIELPPGRYVLVETNNPDWNCRITIEP